MGAGLGGAAGGRGLVLAGVGRAGAGTGVAADATTALLGIMQMAKDRSRGRGGNKGKTTEECKLKGAEHTKNASPSKRPKHQKGRARAGRDQLRKEKGDKSRPY